nr:bifunctional DNA primase/polymerase [Kitasatospora azatica]
MGVDIWDCQSVEHLTDAGEAWLASASEYPRSMRALWESRPWAPIVLPCGRAFDVISMPALFGRRVLDELWASGPGCGPVAAYRGRTLLFVQPGAAPRLRTLLAWEEWARDVPPLLCHGLGDAVTVPPVRRPDDEVDQIAPGILAAPTAPTTGSDARGGGAGRWIVAPDTREPWLPSAGVLLWGCVRAARSETGGEAGGRPEPARAAPRPEPSTAGAPLVTRPAQLRPLFPA